MHPATTTHTGTRAAQALPRGRRGARRRGRGAGGGDPGVGRRDRQERRRPARGEIDQAALRLIARRGAEILATARRYAATPEDAEDAYQRGLEILLRKAPTTREEELVPWLKTVSVR
jgi:Sigma-70 region 2